MRESVVVVAAAVAVAVGVLAGGLEKPVGSWRRVGAMVLAVGLA